MRFSGKNLLASATMLASATVMSCDELPQPQERYGITYEMQDSCRVRVTYMMPHDDTLDRHSVKTYDFCLALMHEKETLLDQRDSAVARIRERKKTFAEMTADSTGRQEDLKTDLNEAHDYYMLEQKSGLPVYEPWRFPVVSP